MDERLLSRNKIKNNYNRYKNYEIIPLYYVRELLFNLDSTKAKVFRVGLISAYDYFTLDGKGCNRMMTNKEYKVLISQTKI